MRIDQETIHKWRHANFTQNLQPFCFAFNQLLIALKSWLNYKTSITTWSEVVESSRIKYSNNLNKKRNFFQKRTKKKLCS